MSVLREEWGTCPRCGAGQVIGDEDESERCCDTCAGIDTGDGTACRTVRRLLRECGERAPEEVTAIADPHTGDVFAVRTTWGDRFATYLLHVPTDELEDVDFGAWPPTVSA